MLVIHMPDNEARKAKRRKRRVRALGYLISGLMIAYCIAVAFAHPAVFPAVAVVEAWWVWASLTDPGMQEK